MSETYVERYLRETAEICAKIDKNQVEKMIQILLQVRAQKGRLFFLGVGGSAANCTHAVNDFRKLAGIETYSPVDNVAELTARTNDEGWDTVFSNWLKVSRINENDAVFVLSVGGGNQERGLSVNLIHAVDCARAVGARVLGVMGRDGGYTGRYADAWIHIPPLSADTVTPHAEGWQGVVWHMIVSDPRMMMQANKWESLEKAPGRPVGTA